MTEAHLWMLWLTIGSALLTQIDESSPISHRKFSLQNHQNLITNQFKSLALLNSQWLDEHFPPRKSTRSTFDLERSHPSKCSPKPSPFVYRANKLIIKINSICRRDYACNLPLLPSACTWVDALFMLLFSGRAMGDNKKVVEKETTTKWEEQKKTILHIETKDWEDISRPADVFVCFMLRREE